MPRGRGMGCGRGVRCGSGPGRGTGNPYPFCRNFPWLPRGWWTGMNGPLTPAPYLVPPYYSYAYGRWLR